MRGGQGAMYGGDGSVGMSGVLCPAETEASG